MDDLISRKALLTEYDRVHIGEPGKARKLIEDAPTVDAVEVAHGRWNDGRCTNCGKYMPFDCEGNSYESLYCPDCGADMRGDGNV